MHSPFSSVVPGRHRQSYGKLLATVAVVLLAWHAKSSPSTDQEPTGAGVQVDADSAKYPATQLQFEAEVLPTGECECVVQGVHAASSAASLKVPAAHATH